MTKAIPAGVAESTLVAALGAMIALLGEDRVLRASEPLEDFRDPYERVGGGHALWGGHAL